MGEVGVWDDIPLIGAIVGTLAKGVCDTEMQPSGESAIPGDLESVVAGAGDIVRLPNRVVALVRAQRVKIRPRGRVQHDFGPGLVNVGLALLVQTSASDITDCDNGAEGQLALNSEIPVPGFRILELAALR